MMIPTTQSGLVRMAQSATPERAAAALNELCVLYWHPVQALIHYKCAGQRWAADEAADLTQAFIAELLTTGVNTYDRSRATRFRSWLFGMVTNFLHKRRAHGHAAKRDGRKTGGWDDLSPAQRVEMEPRHEMTAERIFMSTFAATLVDQAWDASRQWYSGRGQVKRFDVLERFIPLDEIADLDYGTAGAELGLSEVAVRKAVSILRRRYRNTLRALVRELVPSDADVDDELDILLRGTRRPDDDEEDEE